MRLVICHSCWTWMTPTGTSCSECHHFVDVTQPDPSNARLQEVFGRFVSRVATVRVERRELPATGSLVGTTQGLLFVPFLETLPDGGIHAPYDERGRGSVWSLWRFWQQPQLPGRRFAAGSQVLTDAPEPDLVQAFLDSPGALFVARDQLLRLHLRGRCWSLARAQGPVLRITFLSPDEEWKPAWRQLSAVTPEWRALAAIPVDG